MSFLPSNLIDITQKMKFSIKDFFSKCDHIRRKPKAFNQYDIVGKDIKYLGENVLI